MERKALLKNILEKDFYSFCLTFMKVLEPETDFIPSWHHEVICDHLEALAKGEKLQNLDINIPPRMAKSLFVNVLFPCWVWTWWPSCKILSASHTQNLATKFNMKRRRLIASQEYQQFWPIGFNKDANTKSHIENTQNGFMTSFSVGSKTTGEGGDILISDDLISAKEAYSEREREAARIWYFEEYFNRLQNLNEPRRVNVNQRLHEKDISGTIEKEHKNFQRLVIPMVREKKQIETCLNWVDPRKEGELLQKERFNEEQLEVAKKTLGAYGYAGQLQQRPVSIEGGIIKEKWIRKANLSGLKYEFTLISIDASFKNLSTSDYVSMQYWGKLGTNAYLVDKIKGKWDFAETLKKLEFFFNQTRPHMVLIEDKANGTGIISLIKDKVSGLKATNPTESKLARLQAVSVFFECGNVIVSDQISDFEGYKDELISFPMGSNDDEVDATSQALSELFLSSVGPLMIA